jgi:predicted nucleic acid-binding protein
VRWSERILDEALRNAKADNPEKRASIDSRFDDMRAAFPETMVTGHETLIPCMTNEEKDRHVLAAAIVGRADLIVTSNVKDFPV